MLESITIDHVRQVFDGFEKSYEVENDNQILFTLEASDEFPHDIQVRFVVENDWMKVYALPDDFKIAIGDSADYLLAVNHYNTWNAGAKGCLMIIKEINMITLKLENVILFTGPVSVEYFVNGCILYSLQEIRCFFDTIEDSKKKALE